MPDRKTKFVSSGDGIKTKLTKNETNKNKFTDCSCKELNIIDFFTLFCTSNIPNQQRE